MTDRRSGPPLFDLMRERGNHPDAHKPTPAPSQSDAPAPRVQPQAPAPTEVSTKQTAWDSSGGVSRAERSAAAMLDEEVQTETGVRLSSPVFYTIIVLAVALILSAWAVGYKVGENAGASKIEDLVRDQPVVSPAQDTILEPNPRSAVNNSAENVPTTPNEVLPQSTNLGSAPVGIMSPSGFLTEDPREIGLNYLALATLSTEQAADAIAFMYSQGVRVIGVPEVDSSGSSANNPSRYRLYSLGVAIPGNQWSSMSAQRRQHQTLIADLGTRWQRDHRGGSDFSLTNWEKFEG